MAGQFNKFRARVANAIRPKVKVKNATISSPRPAQGGSQDTAVGYRTGQGTSHPLDRGRSSLTRSREWLNLYYKEWTARKIVDIPVGDMLRGGWEYKGLNEKQSREIKQFEQRIGFRKILTQCLKMERLIGGSVMFLGVAGEEEDAKEPLRLGTIDNGDLKFVNPIPRTRIYRAEYDIDPFKPTFGQVRSYYIHGQEIDRSRLLVFDGDPLTENQNIDFGLTFISRDGFGESVLAPIWDDIMRAAGTRQAAFHLINRASSMMILLNNKKSLLESREGKSKINELDEIAHQLSNYHAAILDDKDASIDQWSANFGRVPELLINFLQIISAGSDIPATRFLGQSPGGLNATGESDLENYYNSIEELRKTKLEPRLKKYLAIALPSVFGKNEKTMLDDIEIEFPSLWNLSDVDAATVRTQDATAIYGAFDRDLVTYDEAIAELRQRDVLSTPETDPETEIQGFDDTWDDAGGLEELRGLVDGDSNAGLPEEP